MRRLLALMLVTLSFTALADHWERSRAREAGPLNPERSGGFAGAATHQSSNRYGRRNDRGNDRVELFTVYQACQAALPSSNADRCVQLATSVRFDPRPTISACGAAMYYESDRLRCLEQAFSSGVELSATVTACDQAMYYDSDALACLGLAVNARADLSETVKACDAAMYYDSDARRCIATVATHGFIRSSIAAEVVRACDAAMYYDSDAQRCVQNALPLGGRGPEVIRFCDLSRPYDSQALDCINAFRG
jgi:hypothetical protein